MFGDGFDDSLRHIAELVNDACIEVAIPFERIRMDFGKVRKVE
jgi:hypothetical protein